MTEPGLDTVATLWLHLLSTFLAMENTDSLISVAKVCGGGSVTERVQRFIWNHGISKADGKGYTPYLKNFLKKLIIEIESNRGDVLDKIYAQQTNIMTSLKDDKRNVRVCKSIIFLFSKDCCYLPSCPECRKLMVPLQCSLNMLEGDPGLGADVLYNPSCFRYLVQLLAILLNQRKSYSQLQKQSFEGSMPDNICVDKVNDPNRRKSLPDDCRRASNAGSPVACIATVIRNS